MAKARINCAIALGLLVVGIILLCLYTYNVEPFLPAPPMMKGTAITSIYLYLDKSGNLSFISSNNSKVKASASTNKCTITLPPNSTLQDYGIYTYQTGSNCNSAKYSFPKDSANNCWIIASAGITLSANINNTSGNISSTIHPATQKFKTPQKITKNTLTVGGLSTGNLAITSKSPMFSVNGKKANVRIDLSL